jgi:hypothetical protein
MNSLVISLIRTYVPIAVGTVITLLGSLGITGVDSTEMASVVTAVTIGLYYAVARAIERRKPAAGVLLGHKSAPSYDV